MERKCLRCGTAMVEGYKIRIQKSGNGIEIVTGERTLFPERIGVPKAAVCPLCGEVSPYLKNTAVQEEYLTYAERRNPVPAGVLGAVISEKQEI